MLKYIIILYSQRGSVKCDAFVDSAGTKSISLEDKFQICFLQFSVQPSGKEVTTCHVLLRVVRD